MCDCQISTNIGNISLKERLIYGPSISYTGNLYDTLSKSNYDVCQFFLANHKPEAGGLIKSPSTSWSIPKLSKRDKEKSLQYLIDNNRQFYVHSPLSINLASNKGINVMNQQLDQISGLPAACVVHISKNGTLEDVASNIEQINVPTSSYIPYQLLLETSAGKKGELGANWREIRKLYEAIDSKRIGLCIDTAHLHSSEMSTMISHESIVHLIDKVESTTGHNPNLIHLNGSAYEFGAKKDKHSTLVTNDYIWNEKEEIEGLKSLLIYARDNNVPCICETHNFETDCQTINSFGYDIEI